MVVVEALNAPGDFYWWGNGGEEPLKIGKVADPDGAADAEGPALVSVWFQRDLRESRVGGNGGTGLGNEGLGELHVTLLLGDGAVRIIDRVGERRREYGDRDEDDESLGGCGLRSHQSGYRTIRRGAEVQSWQPEDLSNCGRERVAQCSFYRVPRVARHVTRPKSVTRAAGFPDSSRPKYDAYEPSPYPLEKIASEPLGDST